MSQSDYIQRKKIANELKYQSKFTPVLSTKDYIEFKQFTIANTILNTSSRQNQLVPSDTQIVFNTEFPNAPNCSTFILCSNTQNRPFRVSMSDVYFQSKAEMPLPVYVKQKPLRTCPKCCYGTTSTTTPNTINDINANRTDCSNYRKRSLYCSC